MYTIASYNTKGGVGKTEVVADIADAANRAGCRVLVVDADPQGNLTQRMGVSQDTLIRLDHILDPDQPVKIEDAICSPDGPWQGIDIIGASEGMERFARLAQPGLELDLHHLLRDSSLPDRYDLVLIDCPPNPGFFTLSALIAADSAMIVTHPSASSRNGVIKCLNVIGFLRKRQAPHLNVIGVVINDAYIYETNTKAIIDELQGALGDDVFATIIPHRTVITQAETREQPVSVLPGSEASAMAKTFTNLFTELTERIPTP